jgi:hypothetical protein
VTDERPRRIRRQEDPRIRYVGFTIGIESYRELFDIAEKHRRSVANLMANVVERFLADYRSAVEREAAGETGGPSVSELTDAPKPRGGT